MNTDATTTIAGPTTMDAYTLATMPAATTMEDKFRINDKTRLNGLDIAYLIKIRTIISHF